MKQVVVDSGLQAILNGCDERLELTTPAGKTLCYFVPQKDYDDLMRARLSLDPPAEERDATRQEKGQDGQG